MKQLSLVFNLVLLIAVGVLYYLHFSGKDAGARQPAVVRAAPVSTDGKVVAPLIAYVELDSLNEKITFIKNKRKELEAEQKTIEQEWENGYRDLERQRDNFLKKGNSITQEEAQQMQMSLMSQQEKIDERKQTKVQKLSERSFNAMDDIQKKLKEFMEDYNREKNYMYILTTGTGLDYMVYKDSTLNITNDVIEGMNQKLSAGKQ
ncbi:MAG TPA: OmpH family outer membrane protein [Ferruginibacter sp.]|nr:OmpH family outer membrane protein [Ferruginibacter sp.]HRO17521.1 OmpH family outer membrane protein [Ferruginibacter sp.]HRQ20968.1 OmpH family outer membrane protein [Ferruginibacter sp.]